MFPTMNPSLQQSYLLGPDVRRCAIALLAALWIGSLQPVCSQTATEEVAETDAQDLPAATEILENYLEATGGRSAHEKVNNMRLTGTFSASGASGPIVITRARPAKISVRIDIEGVGKIDQGTDGEVAWDANPMQGITMLEGERKSDLIRRADFDEELHPEKVFKSLTCTGIEDVDDRECYRVECKLENEKKEIRYFDKDSHLLVRTDAKRITPVGEIDITKYFADYRDAGEIKIPYKNTIEVMGQVQEIVLENVEINADLPKDTFMAPEADKEPSEENTGS